MVQELSPDQVATIRAQADAAPARTPAQIAAIRMALVSYRDTVAHRLAKEAKDETDDC